MTVSFTVHPGKPEPLGVTVEPGGLNVAVVAPDADAVEIVLFDADGQMSWIRRPGSGIWDPLEIETFENVEDRDYHVRGEIRRQAGE